MKTLPDSKRPSTLREKIEGLVGGKKKRKGRQKAKERYAMAREDAQLAGVIDTVPEGAVRDERVDPTDQKEQPLPSLVGQAIRKGWATPEDKKPGLVDEMVGVVEDPEAPQAVKVMAYNALRAGDKDQWERDNPEQSAKSKGSVNVGVGVQVTQAVDLSALLKAAEQQREQARRLSENPIDVPIQEGRPGADVEASAGADIGSQRAVPSGGGADADSAEGAAGQGGARDRGGA